MSSPSCLRFGSLLLPFLFLPLLPTVFTFSQKDCQQSRLVAQKNSLVFKSHSNEFALGFHPVRKSNETLFLLAVWFNNIGDSINERTIVWSANGNELAPLSSEFKLSSKGDYVLNNPNGKELWRTQTNGTKSACAAILDNGNFVILDKNYSPIWESFKEPTDTILPGQILSNRSILTPRKSGTDYADGHFQLRVRTYGTVGLYPVYLPDEDSRGPYWETIILLESGPGFFDEDVKLYFDEDGKLYFDDGWNASTSQGLHSMKDQGSNQTFYYLARVDHDGVFRLYKRRKDKSVACDETCHSSWTIVQEIPDNICHPYYYSSSVGWCGYNSICEKKSGRPVCKCPYGYSYLDPFDPSKGCKADFPPPNCQPNAWESKKELVVFKEIRNITWASAGYLVDWDPKMDKARCQEICLHDCFCVAAIYDDHQCRIKGHPLSNGRNDKDLTGTALLKVPKVNVIHKKDHSTLVLVMALLLGSSGFLNILFFIATSVALFFLYRKKRSSVDMVSTSTPGVRRYTYKELEKATGGFTQSLGRGAFGTVYKGVLPSHPRRFVAVKKLDKVVDEGEKEFKTEVSVICQTHHKNLVRLLGYSDEDDHRLLVYEYMSNGSLATFLFGISRPHWNQRVQITLGIARGLMYLHEECSTQIIHCDIKPQNILLDENCTPRISDFGLAKLLLADQSKIQTQRRGTIGYFAPEWFKKASISVKVDVYSFGVMLLEIICCKSSVSFAMGNEEEALIDWAYECYKEKRLEKMIENDEEARNDMDRVERLVTTAIWCIQEDPSLRPTMKKVTQMLEGVVGVYVPPRPSLFVSPSLLIIPYEHL